MTTLLEEFISTNRDTIIERCRDKVAMRSAPPPTPEEIKHGVPVFLTQLEDTLRFGLEVSPEIGQTASQHGHELLALGFTVSQVVHDYGDICQSITDLAVETRSPISADDFRTLNRCLDDAIAGAVTAYGRDRRQVDRHRVVSGDERLEFLVHELRNLTNTAIVAFEVMKTGNVGVAGNTGGVLQRSLLGLRTLIGHSVAAARIAHNVQNREPFLMTEFMEELRAAGALAANEGGVSFTMEPVEPGIAIEADRQVLAAVVSNLLQNAFKFTRPRTTVTLRVGASPERVLIEIVDECGGLPNGNVDDLFRPFEQRGADRSGLGLGLAFSHAAVEANNGRIYARNLPGHGCVFVVDLPRIMSRALAPA